jgi:hypothetical protein
MYLYGVREELDDGGEAGDGQRAAGRVEGVAFQLPEVITFAASP